MIPSLMAPLETPTSRLYKNGIIFLIIFSLQELCNVLFIEV